MSNSSLVSYTKISPNRNSPRNHAIDTITIHCVVGQLSAESIAGCFINPSRRASCNYGIGTDGRIALIVEEKDRSWCSSSAANDNRAITIECASDTKHPYAINDRVYKSLINLCADICKRNNIKALKWRGDKSLIGHTDKQNMTVHRWFANKACPGDYIYNRLGQIADEVNEKLGGQAPAPQPSVPDVTVTESGIDVKYQTYAAGKWWGDIVNYNDVNSDGYAGVRGKAMSALRANTVGDQSIAGNLQYRVYVPGFGWLDWVTDRQKDKNGDDYAGIYGRNFTAVQMRLINCPGKKVQYRTSNVNQGYYAWVTEMENEGGFAGDKKNAIDRIQIRIVNA